MELSEIKIIILNRINQFNITDIDVNKIKITSSKEELALLLVSDVQLYFNTGVLTIELFKSFFDIEMLKDNFIFVEGEHSIYGSKEVVALGATKLRMYNNSTVHAYQHCVIYANTLSNVFAYDNVKVYAKDDTKIKAYNSVSVEASMNVCLYAHDFCVINALDNCQIHGFNWAKLTVNDTCSVYLSDNSFVLSHGRNNVVMRNCSKGKIMNEGCVNAYDNSCVSLYGRSIGKLYGESMGRFFEESKGESYDNSRIYSNGNTSIKCLDSSYGCCHRAANVMVFNIAHVLDYSNTHTNVNENGTIKWRNGELFQIKQINEEL